MCETTKGRGHTRAGDRCFPEKDLWGRQRSGADKAWLPALAPWHGRGSQGRAPFSRLQNLNIFARGFTLWWPNPKQVAEEQAQPQTVNRVPKRRGYKPPAPWQYKIIIWKYEDFLQKWQYDLYHHVHLHLHLYAMLCYVVLCYALVCHVMLCYAVLCYDMLCYAMSWYVM